MENSELAPLLEQYISTREAEGEIPESRPELARLAGDLDKVYWIEVEKVLTREARENRAQLHFSPRDRLLLDLGLLDWDLFPGGRDNRVALLRELYGGPDSRELYFSEWMAQRFRHFTLYGSMAADDGAARSGSRIIRKIATVKSEDMTMALILFPLQTPIDIKFGFASSNKLSCKTKPFEVPQVMKRIVLAYLGGLDNSCAIRWLL